jgi:hypothetical protein
MKKLLFLLFILPVFCFAQSPVTPAFKRKIPVDSLLGYSFPGVTGTFWLPDTAWVKKHGAGGGGNNIYNSNGSVTDPTRLILLGQSNLEFIGSGNIEAFGQGLYIHVAFDSTFTNPYTSSISLQAQYAKLGYEHHSTGIGQYFIIDGKMTVLDSLNQKGLENSGDYESNFTGRSLITKQYADAHYGGTYTFSGGLTDDGSGNVSLGGNIGSGFVDLTVGAGGFDVRTTSGNINSINVSTTSANIQNTSTDGQSIIGTNGSSNTQTFVQLEDNSTNQAGFYFTISSLKVLDAIHSRGLLYNGNYTTNQRLNRLAIPSVNTVIALADSIKSTISGGTGTVTSITPGVGFLSHTPITTSGTMNVDTAGTIGSKSWALAAFNTKAQSASTYVPLTRTLTAGLGMQAIGDLSTNRTIATDTTVLKSKVGALTDYNNLKTSIAAKMANPMTATGDIIYSSDNSGTPARLGIGTTNHPLIVTSGLPAYSPGALVLASGSTLQTTGAFTLNLTTTANSTPTFPTGTGTLVYLAGTNNWPNLQGFGSGFYTDLSGGSVTSNMRLTGGGALGGSATNSYFLVDGSTSVMARMYMAGQDNSQSLAPGGAGFNLFIASSPITLSSGTSPISAGFGIRAPTLTGSGAFTDVATIYSQGVPTGGTATNRWNGWFKYGLTRVSGLQVDTLSASQLVGTDANKRFVSLGTLNSKPHTIFTPTTGGSVTLTNNQYNIINPTGTLVALTVNLPSSPVNNDCVFIKYTQAVTTVTYAGGTVIDGVISPAAGGLVVLTYDSATTSWY